MMNRKRVKGGSGYDSELFNEESVIIHSRPAASLYGIASLLPVCLLALVVAGCATPPPTESHLDTATGDAGYDSPEEALEAFSEAWNRGAMTQLIGTFIPGRRQTIRSVDAELRPRLEVWHVENGRVEKQCHPRGAYWKTAVVELRAGPNREREVVWLRLVDGRWWMYAL